MLKPSGTLLLIGCFSLSSLVIGIVAVLKRDELARQQLKSALGIPAKWRTDPEIIRTSSFGFLLVGSAFAMVGVTGFVAILIIGLGLIPSG